MRRIVAVTRELAKAARERAEAFEALIDRADKIEGLALDTEVGESHPPCPPCSSLCFRSHSPFDPHRVNPSEYSRVVYLTK